MRRNLCVFVIGVCLAGLPLAALGQTAGSTTAELEALKAQLAAQQEQIRQLRELLLRQGMALEALQRHLGLSPATVSLASLPAPVVEAADASASPADASLEQRVEKLEGAVAETKKENEGLKGRLRSLSFSGDLRIRYEPFFQAGTEQRHRERARFRFQVASKITDELSGGFRLASGGLDNAQSTNQTFTGFFTRKAVDLDRFWLTYKPQRASWLTVTAGKFEYPWFRTELTFDNDLNPEGFAQTLSFNFKDSPLANLTLVGFELPFNEVGTGGDSFIWGGQVQTHWKLSEKARLGLHAAGINFRNVDALAVAIGNGSLRPSLGLSNLVRRNTSGNIIGYAERFAYVDLIADLRYAWRPRWPVRLTLDFVNNVRASDERSGYWGEFTLGRTDEKGDWLLGYTLARIEREAVIGAYNFDDLRSSTNVLHHRGRVAYQVHRNVTLEWTLLIGRLFNAQDNLTLVPGPFQPLGKDPYLKRMQFDVIYKF
ncbi:MAG: putative porin [Candidatus Acidiferrales bacterium]